MQPTNEANPEVKAETEAIATEPDEMIASLEARLATAEKERDEFLDLAQRNRAEFENFRKRNSAVRAEAWDESARETIAQILPVIDNLERALATDPDKSAFCEGVELVHKQLLDILTKRGVAVIDRAGEPFDPALENAIAQAPASEGEPGTVCDVLQKGYRMGDRVIRHAMVRVVASE